MADQDKSFRFFQAKIIYGQYCPFHSEQSAAAKDRQAEKSEEDHQNGLPGSPRPNPRNSKGSEHISAGVVFSAEQYTQDIKEYLFQQK